MATLAAVLFAIGALGGVILAHRHFAGKTRPWPLAILHGLAGAAGIVLLTVYVLQTGGNGKLYASLASFVLAALGGFVLFSFHIRGVPLSSPVVLVHGGVAVVGFLILIAAIFF